MTSARVYQLDATSPTATWEFTARGPVHNAVFFANYAPQLALLPGPLTSSLQVQLDVKHQARGVCGTSWPTVAMTAG
ncbi:hypothetical protein HaLaN_00579 [Haematococcus lacustris]|uniref:Uncharacterized protein n=1 Tax=Haematococcus lacustris TaxID=44745 RepID=A0A699Y724_HAELA|nr:hypothetical protein HaLaN_00579 [Haematococcus lacustris]